VKYLIIGIILLVIGILVKFFPKILAGYSNLSQRERENAEINRLPFILSLITVLMGVLIIVGYFASLWLEQPELITNFVTFVILGGAVAVVIVANRLTNNRIR
jgi:vacuolar-type H+-ATPase subunit I/STV1